MTLYGIGLGPGAADLLTVRGKRRLEPADVVYLPGRLSRRVAAEYVPESKLSGLEFPMTTDPDELQAAWKTAAAEVAPNALDADATFVTLGDLSSTRRSGTCDGRFVISILTSTSRSFPVSVV